MMNEHDETPIGLPAMPRRTFLKNALLGSVALGTCPAVATTAAGANETIRIGCIGVGGRGSALLADILALGEKQNVKVVAVCDVWRKNREAAAKRILDKSGQAPRQFTRFDELLALKELDAVTIATPDQPSLASRANAGACITVHRHIVDHILCVVFTRSA
ncbi:MAG TPA: Gfo/Idh/MocA family oxidoreductase [Verrucomicrobiae bacterium]